MSTSVTLSGVTFTDEDFAEFGFQTPVEVNGVLYPRWQAVHVAALEEMETIRAPGGISLSSVAVGPGPKAWTLTDAASMTAGTWVAYSAGSPSNFMICTLAASISDSTALSMTSRIAVGSGTYTDWVFAPLNNTRGAVAIKTSAYTVTVAEFRALIVLNKSTADTLTIPAVSSVGTAFEVGVINIGAGVWSLTPNASDAWDGGTAGASIKLRKGDGVTFASIQANDLRVTSAIGYGVPLKPWPTVITGSQVVDWGWSYQVDTSGGAVTLQLAASAPDQAEVEFIDYARNWSTAKATIDANTTASDTVVGYTGSGANTYDLDVTGMTGRFRRKASTSLWRKI